MQSQIFGVKSNAARAAAKYGIKRDDLIAVSGGWCFNIPSETAPQSPTEPATEAVNGANVETPANGATSVSEPAAPADEPLDWAGVDYMVVNGETPVKVADLVEQDGEPIEAAPAKPKAKRQRKPKAEKPKVKREPTGDTKNAAPKAGKGAELIAELKRGWLSVPQMLQATGWLKHTLRGYISRIAKAEGWTLERDKVDGVTRYRIRA
jgi:Protein of unknown function (DUF3489)